MKAVFIGIGLLISQTVLAQQNSLTDYYYNPLLREYNQTISTDINLLRFIPYEGLGTAELSFQHFNGGLKPVQQADAVNDFKFKSYGAKKLKRFTLAGGFTYNRKLTDSVRWNHKSKLNENSPFYFGSQAATNYDHISYQLDALANYRASDKINVGLGADYYVGSSFSSNDPRGKLEPFKLSLKANANVQIANNQYLNGSVNWGYGFNDVVIDYKNKVYYESLAYPAYNTYFNYGMGYVVIQGKPERRKLIQEYDYSGFSLGYSNVSDHVFLNAQLRYDKKSEQARFGSRTSLDENTPIGNFDVDQYQFDAMAKFDDDFLIKLMASRQHGQDKNALFSGINNYINEYNELQLHALKSFGAKRKEHTLGLKIDYADTYSADGSAATMLNHAYLAVGVSYQKAFQYQTHLLSIGLTADYKKPLFSEIGYSVNNLNTFINDVVFNEYYFKEMDILRTGLFVNSIVQLDNFLPLQLAAHISHSNTFTSNPFDSFGGPLNNWEFGCSIAILVY